MTPVRLEPAASRYRVKHYSLNVHEIIMMAFNVVFWKMRKLSVASVSPVSCKLGLASASHTPDNSGGSPSIPSVMPHREPGCFLVPILCVGPFVQKSPTHFQL